jgi:NRAMP (natural resistance-associated macrophage protein)-like metal ion transporter
MLQHFQAQYCRYMDPGNWATNIAAGSQFGYTLLIAVLLSSGTAMFLQHLSLKLGVVSSRDLAQACRDAYPAKVLAQLCFVVPDVPSLPWHESEVFVVFTSRL